MSEIDIEEDVKLTEKSNKEKEKNIEKETEKVNNNVNNNNIDVVNVYDNDNVNNVNNEEMKEKDSTDLHREKDNTATSSKFIRPIPKFRHSQKYNFDDEFGNRFEFIKPATIKDPELNEAFFKNGINSKNCLIIKNKDSFLNHLCKIRDVLSKVLIEYINFILLNNLNKNRIDPSRQQVRRKGFSLINKDLINKEMFLNTQNVGEPEKGILI